MDALARHFRTAINNEHKETSREIVGRAFLPAIQPAGKRERLPYNAISR
jgi:hypothetical protein